MNRRSVFQEFTIVVSAKQKPDGLWVPDIRINPEPSPETRGSLNKDFAFKTRTEAEEHGMKIADDLIYKTKRRDNKLDQENTMTTQQVNRSGK
jgi:hypothetical protein